MVLFAESIIYFFTFAPDYKGSTGFDSGLNCNVSTPSYEINAR